MSSPSSASGHHRAHAPAASDVRVAIVTASDSRTADTNEGGQTLRRLLEAAGFTVVADAILAEEPALLRDEVARLARDSDAVLVTGGTGISPRDRTPDAVAPLFERRLPGFGELFRTLSFQAIGPAAMLSRADAGVVGSALVFLLPGSPAAVELALEKLIVPELAHAVGQLRRRHAHGATHA